MIDRVLRFVPRGILILAIVLLVSFVIEDILSMMRISAVAKEARSRAVQLSQVVESHTGQSRFTPPPKDPAQASGKALSAWTDVTVPRDAGSDWYDFYPR